MAKWEDEWKATKRKFETITGVKKPSEKVLGMFRKSSGLESALKKCDEQYTLVSQKSTRNTLKEADLKGFVTAIADYTKTKTSYLKLVDKAIHDDKSIDTEAETKYSKGLQMLKAELEALEKTMESQAAVYDAAIKKLGAVEQTAKNLITATKGAVARALSACAKIKADPTAEVFNGFFPKTARDITQQVGNVGKLREKGYEMPGGDTQKLFDALKPWANDGRKVVVPAKASAEDEKRLVLAELREFQLAVKDVVDWVSHAR